MQDLCEERESIVGVDEGGQCAVVDVASSEECKRVTSDALSEVVELQKKIREREFERPQIPTSWWMCLIVPW